MPRPLSRRIAWSGCADAASFPAIGERSTYPRRVVSAAYADACRARNDPAKFDGGLLASSTASTLYKE